MYRLKKEFPLSAGAQKKIKQQMLDWAKQFSIFIFLDSNEYKNKHARYECLLAANPASLFSGDESGLLHEIYNWHQQHKDWLFGHICYDFKNALEERLLSEHVPKHIFPQLNFFCPQIVCFINKEGTTLGIESIDVSPEEIFKQITETRETIAAPLPEILFEQKIAQQNYIETIQRLRQHIADGDCYEINFCNEGFATDVVVEPTDIFKKLNEISPAPFAAYYKMEQQHMMCASPERYLYKDGNTVLSQPIKGTARRGENAQDDEVRKLDLYNSIKERAENVMIVDLVRNDLARSCETGTVAVDELFGIYSFPQVHQMISTVRGILKPGVSFTDAIRYSFPMGSMTGAPKFKVMQLIERYEQSRRELFSGTVGYITPDADFDFNVIIRSLFYNEQAKYLSYQTGGAITFDSDPQQEWQEMRLKAWALEKIFGQKQKATG